MERKIDVGYLLQPGGYESDNDRHDDGSNGQARPPPPKRPSQTMGLEVERLGEIQHEVAQGHGECLAFLG